MAAPTLFLTQGIAQPPQSDFAADVRGGLLKPGQKELPSKYLYDEVGSALFEAICLLPEYGLNRAGGRLMQRHAEDLVRRLPMPVIVAELGSGNGTNTRWLLEALSRREAVSYFPIDISSLALHRCRQELGRIDSVSMVGFERAYLRASSKWPRGGGPANACWFFFLAAPLGILTVQRVRIFFSGQTILQPGDALLLATDLEKPVAQLMQAYDDPAGVTAAFDRNLLARINRELDADFSFPNFRHIVRWNDGERRVEMHLQSQTAQRVSVPLAGCTIDFGLLETIWTESSHKYNIGEVLDLSAAHRLPLRGAVDRSRVAVCPQPVCRVLTPEMV